MTMTMLRRRWLTMPVAVLAASVALTGCSGSDEGDRGDKGDKGDKASGSSSELVPQAEGEASYPMTLKSPWGETELKERPERIAIATAANDLDNALALGVTPVWVDDYTASYSWTTAAGADKIEDRGEVSDVIPVEDIAASGPDLIIAIQTDAGILEDAYDKLTEVAPVLTVEEPSWDVSWQESVRTIGAALDLEQRAEGVIEDVDATIADAAKAHPEFEGTSLSMVLWLDHTELTYRSFEGSGPQEVFAKLGFTSPPAASEFSRDSIKISAENYRLADADVILVAAAKKALDDLLKVPTFSSIPAIEEGRYAYLDMDQETEIGWAVSWPSALSVPWFVDKITAPLAETLG